jgi:5'-nucleotidase
MTSFEGNNFDSAGRVARELVERFIRNPIREPVLLNVNVPDIPHAELKGMEVTRLGRRHKAEPVVKMISPRRETVYWVGAAGAAADAGRGTDFNAVERGFVSITPLQIDLTHTAQLSSIDQWMK